VQQKVESNILKNAIESADYYPDSRKRRQELCYSFKKVFDLISSRLLSLDYGSFSSRRTLFKAISLRLQE
jgi:hypothetical protein